MENAVKRIGVLTSGGDAPGMNAAVRAVVRAATFRGIECIGIRRGYTGLINGDFMKLTTDNVSHIINRGGTMLYTARCEEFRTVEGQQKAAATCKLLGLGGIIGIGGDGTFRGLVELSTVCAIRCSRTSAAPWSRSWGTMPAIWRCMSALRPVQPQFWCRKRASISSAMSLTASVNRALRATRIL